MSKSATSESVSPQAQRHRTHYFDCLTFKVEDVLFKVPRHQFQQNSEIFASMLTLPVADPAGVEGQSDEKPIVLETIKSADFESFVAVLYPVDAPAQYSLSKEQWISVLKLSTLWNFLNIRKLAMSRLNALKLEPAERVLLGRECSVPTWLREGYLRFVQSATPMSKEDAAAIGWETAFLLGQEREKIIIDYGRNHHDWTTPGGVFTQIKNVVWEEDIRNELAVVETAGATYERHSAL